MAFCCLWIWACWNVFFQRLSKDDLSTSASVFANVSINGDAAIAETDADFICATLDWWPPEKCDYGTCSWGNASVLNLDLESSLLENAVKAFDPLKIRLGGTLQDKVIYDVGELKQPCHPFAKNVSVMFGFTYGCLPMSRWDALNLFFKKTRVVVAFGLNALNGRKELSTGVLGGPWDSTNAYNFIQYTVDHGYQVNAWELGVDKHLLEKILDPSYISQEESTFKSLKTILENYGPWSSAWVGEAGGAYNSGHHLVTNAFIFSFWYLDQLGMASMYNTKTYCRQSLIGGNYGLLNTTTYVPNPDYYSALLWHRLMGARVLSLRTNGTQYMRTYAHCTKNDTGVTLLFINLSKLDRIIVGISTYSQNGGQKNLTTSTNLVKGKSRLEYHLTAKDGDLHSQTMLLNGKALEVSPKGEIPSLEPVEVNPHMSILIDPLSIAFVSLPYVQLLACSR